MESSQVKKSRWENIDKRLSYFNNITLKIGLWLLIITALILLWKEYHRDQFLINPINVPLSFEQQGIKPAVAAQRIFDEINSFQKKVTSVREASSYSTNQSGSSVDFQVAGFGLSVQSLARQLRSATGKPEQIIRGEILEGADSVSLRLRFRGEIVAQIKEALHSNREICMNSLAAQVAEKLFAITEPYLYAVHIRNTRPPNESLPLAKKLINSPVDKKWGLNLTGNIYGVMNRPLKAIDYYKQAEQVDPDFALPKRNLAYLYKGLDSIDLALEYFEKATAIYNESNKPWLMAEQYYLLKKHKPNDPKLIAIRNDLNNSKNVQNLTAISANLTNQGDFQEGYYWAKQALALNPDNTMAMATTAMLSCAFKETENCQKYVNDYAESDPESKDLKMAIAIQVINENDINKLNSLVDELGKDSLFLQRGDFKSILSMHALLNGDSTKAKEYFLNDIIDSTVTFNMISQLKFLEPLFVFLPESIK